MVTYKGAERDLDIRSQLGMGGDSGPVGPFVIHVAGGQRARQSVVLDRLQGKMFSNRILFSVISFKSRIPIVLHIFSDRGGS